MRVPFPHNAPQFPMTFPIHLTRDEIGQAAPFYDELAPEEPLEIRVEGQSVVRW